jgi:hypothetical protein
MARSFSLPADFYFWQSAQTGFTVKAGMSNRGIRNLGSAGILQA